MKRNDKQRLLEVMKRLNPEFKGKVLTEEYDSGVENDRHSTAPEDAPGYKKNWSGINTDPNEKDFGSDEPEEEEVDEISTGMANAAATKANNATNTAYNTDNPLLGQRRNSQASRFKNYINPALEKVINPEYQQRPESLEGFSIYKADNGSTILSINPNPGQEVREADKILISIKPEGYSITNGSADQIPQTKLPKVMNFVKLIQADLKSEKTKVNPAAPQQQVAESPMFGGEKVSQDQYDELQYDKSTMEKAMGDAFKTPPGYQMKHQVKGGETIELSDGDKVKVMGVDGSGYIKVRVFPTDEETKKYFPKGYFDISWSPVQFDAIVGNQTNVNEKFNRWGQSQDDWADIEGTNTERGKDLQKKANLAKKGPQGNDAPEYMNTYDSESPQVNVNGLSQNQIDKTNADKRGDMEREVRRSMDRGDGMYESEEKFKFGQGTKSRLFEVIERVAPVTAVKKTKQNDSK